VPKVQVNRTFLTITSRAAEMLGYWVDKCLLDRIASNCISDVYRPRENIIRNFCNVFFRQSLYTELAVQLSLTQCIWHNAVLEMRFLLCAYKIKPTSLRKSKVGNGRSTSFDNSLHYIEDFPQERRANFSIAKKKNKPFQTIMSSLTVLRSVTTESYPRNRPWRPIGLWDVKDPTLSRQSAHS
jgi:hypothetical protein